MNDVPPPPPPGQPPWGEPPTGGTPPGDAPDAGHALSYGWSKFQTNLGPLLAVILIPFAAQVLLQLVGNVAIGGTFGYAVFGIAAMVVGLALQIGVFNMGLMITRGEEADIGRAFSTDRWGEWILFAFVYGLLVSAGLLVCGVGALVVVAFFGLAPYYFLEQGLSLGEALSKSLETTRATNGLPIALALVALVGFAGVIVCGVGALVTMPIAYVAGAFLYRRATNQDVAA